MVFTSVVFPFLASNLLSVVPLLLGIFLLNQKGLKGGLQRLRSGSMSELWSSKPRSKSLQKVTPYGTVCTALFC
jgi:hypothetical protein